jgi:DNA-binding transcriptional LysR family regulator
MRLLRVFCTVVESGGYTPAQVSLNIGQSTISSHMTVLEQRLGVRLCDRGRGGFRVTQDGQAVYEAAQRLFRSMESFGSEVEALRGRITGDIHLGVVDSVATNPDFALSAAIARFGRRGGKVTIHLHVAPPAEIERAVVEGRFHLGIGGYTKQISSLEYTALIKELQLLYCGASHRLFERKAVRLDDLLDCPAIKRSYVPDEFIPYSEVLKSAAYAENMDAIAMLILSGRFVAFLPQHYAARWEGSAMRCLLPETMRYYSQLELIARSTAPQPLAVQILKRDILNAFDIADQAASPTVRPLVSSKRP